MTLFGITVRNSIMLLSHDQHMVREEGCDWNLEIAVRGARERFVPILIRPWSRASGSFPWRSRAARRGGRSRARWRP